MRNISKVRDDKELAFQDNLIYNEIIKVISMLRGNVK